MIDLPLQPVSTYPSGAGERQAAAATSWIRRVGPFVLFFTIIWLVLDAASVMLPFLRPGAVVIADAKFDTLVTGTMFGPQDRNRVMIFGHSKVLASVRPLELDAAIGPGFRSYNLGLPGEVHFLPILEAALSAGNVPTHVLLTLPWDARPSRDGLLDALLDDAGIASILFPFRTLPRDAALFVFQNRNRLTDAVRDVAIQRDTMLKQRGWYFIKSQSHYENDALPDDYALPTDHPARADVRVLPDASYVRERLGQLASQYGFQVLFIPLPYRAGEAAPASSADSNRLVGISEHPSIRVIGPDYLIYPPADFADPVHMNPRGALAYTADLARLLKMSGAFD